MFCKNCGIQIADSAAFCPSCGKKTDDIRTTSVQNNVPPNMKNTENQSASKNNLPIIITAIICGVLLFAAVLIFGIKLLMPKPDIEPISPVPTAMPLPTNAPLANGAEDIINAFIETTKGQQNISVSVIDNNTNYVYNSENAGAVYPAWGFYLPIYLAAEDAPSYVDSTTRSNILSSDPGVCNSAGNAVIRKFGGPSGISSHLRYAYNIQSTSYGRYFGEVSSAGQNLTTATEAVRFLQALNGNGEYAKLSYNIESFGIQAPAGAQVYAQVGTENKSKLENLNLFAIVKSANSNYCVAVMTRNGAGKNGLISNLIFSLHQEMERMGA